MSIHGCQLPSPPIASQWPVMRVRRSSKVPVNRSLSLRAVLQPTLLFADPLGVSYAVGRRAGGVLALGNPSLRVRGEARRVLVQDLDGAAGGQLPRRRLGRRASRELLQRRRGARL